MFKLKLKLLFALLLCGSAYAQQKDGYVAIGDILCSDGLIRKPEDFPASGKNAQGVVCYVDETGQHGWVVHRSRWACNTSGWSSEYVDTPAPNKAAVRDFDNPSASLIKDCDGKANTEAVINMPGFTKEKYPPFEKILELNENVTDPEKKWYIPSAGQVNYMIAHRAVLDDSMILINETTHQTTYPIMRRYNSSPGFDRLYALSDEYSANEIWYLDADCSFKHTVKTVTTIGSLGYSVRPFRNF